MKFSKKAPSVIDQELEMAITEQIQDLRGRPTTSDEYEQSLAQLERLYKLRAPQKELRKPASGDALIASVTSIGGILAILGFERTHVLTTKALGMIVKPKL